MKNRLLFIISMLLFCIDISYGQTKSISGVVKDAMGEPIIGVSILVKNTTNGVVTDFDGKYNLQNVPNGATIVYSYIGMVTQEFKVGNSSTINVTLKDDTKALDEVVVIGYGTTTKRKLVGSVSSIGSDKLENTTFSNVQNALQGQVPGLIIQNSGSGVNDVPTVSIRGAGTPLFVIDGIISDEFVFSTLNPEDISKMSFLKDASATAVYGSRAGNGIVLVETKKGKVGTPSIRYSGNIQFSQPTVIADRLSGLEFAELSNEVFQRDEHKNMYEQDVLDQIGKSYDYPDNDWTDLAFKDYSTEQKHNVSISGGSEFTKYFISVGNVSNNGILKDNASTLNKTNFRSNIETNFKNIGLTVGAGLSANIKNTREPYETKWKNLLYQINPLVQGYNPDGTLSSADLNPLQYFAKDAGYKKYRKKYMNAQLNLTWKPKFVQGLSLGAMANYSDIDYFNKEWNRSPERYSWDKENNISIPYQNKTQPSLKSTSGYNRVIDLEARANYQKSFGKHTIDALVLYTQRTNNSDYVMAQKKGYQSELIDEINVGPLDGMTSEGTSAEGGSAGLVGRLKYDFLSKYIIEVSGRYDGNDNFVKGKRWGFFPSVSAVWIISDENFMKPITNTGVLNLLKLRGSYGETGITDGVTRFGYISAYKQETWSPNYYTVDGKVVAGFKEGDLVSPNELSWYTRKSANIGFDFTMLNNQIEGSVDYFYYTTTGYLSNPANIYSTTLGKKLPQIKSNTQHRRSGYEFALRYKKKMHDLYFEIGGNLSYYNQLYKQLDTEDMATLKNPYQRITHQKDYYAIMLKSNGLFQSAEETLNNARPIASTSTQAGEIRYIDANGDGKIDDNDKRRIEKPNDPHLNYGIDFNVSYKEWSLTGLFQGTGARYTYLGENVTNNSISRVLLKYQANAWTPENRNAEFPIIHSSEAVNGSNNSLVSDFYMRNAQYLRLKNLQLTYNMKKRVLKNVSCIKGCTLTLTGTNLLTFSDVFDYMDPEAKLLQIKDLGQVWTMPGDGFPMNRTYSFGVNLEF